MGTTRSSAVYVGKPWTFERQPAIARTCTVASQGARGLHRGAKCNPAPANNRAGGTATQATQMSKRSTAVFAGIQALMFSKSLALACILAVKGCFR